MSTKRKNLGRPFELRDISITDASDYQKAFNASVGHLEKYLEWGARATEFDLKRCQDILMRIAAEKYPDRTFAICSWGKLVGEINFGEGSRQDGLQMTYWVSKNNAGQGLCTKAVKKLMDKAFLMENINFLEIHADKNNLASKKVAKKAGFVHYDSYEYEGSGSEGTGIMDVFIYLTPRARYVATMAKFFGGEGIDLEIRPNSRNRRERFKLVSTQK